METEYGMWICLTGGYLLGANTVKKSPATIILELGMLWLFVAAIRFLVSRL